MITVLTGADEGEITDILSLISIDNITTTPLRENMRSLLRKQYNEMYYRSRILWPNYARPYISIVTVLVS